MELVVETGQGIPGADSYNSIAELDAYMEKFGYADWPITAQPETPPDDEQGGEEPPEESGQEPENPDDKDKPGMPEPDGGNEGEEEEGGFQVGENGPELRVSDETEGGETGGDETPDPEQPEEPGGETEDPDEPQEPDNPDEPQEPDEPEPPAEDPILIRKQAAARRAAIYIDSTYGVRFTGVPTTSDQGLAWPRTGAVDFFGRDIPDDKIPIEIKRAHAEVTLLAFKNTPLAPDAAGGQILKRKKVDVLEWEWDVDSYGNPPIFGWVDKLLLPLLGPASEIGAMDILGVQRA